MTDVLSPLPMRRPELAVSPLGEKGKHVVKDPLSGDYFHLGAVEAFLLEQLDGQHTPAQICAAFEARFDDPLTADELADFIELARTRGLVQTAAPPTSDKDQAAATKKRALEPAQREAAAPSTTPTAAATATPQPAATRRRQSILYWRKSLFDPDRLFNWLEPKIRFLWTRAFLVISLIAILAAILVVWANGQQVITQFTSALRWETLVLAWLTMIVATTCHEFAHGLTCKRYGGEVHEIGFLLMFFMPCFYCNVSDAWLFREKTTRLWVTLAGAYCDLCIWALAVFVWRLTLQDSLLNYLAWVVISVTGVRLFFNFNPLLKLDGYYLLSDLVEEPNLRQRGIGYLTNHVRWLLWGAPRPAREPRGKFRLSYGIACWLFSVIFLTMMAVALARFLGTHLGMIGFAGGILLGVVLLRGLFKGFFGEEVRRMIRIRHRRTALWVAALAAIFAVLGLVKMEDHASGTFQMRPVAQAELRAPVTGFLQAAYYDEGDHVSSGTLVARLEVIDLTSRIAQKRAEVQESEANLRRMSLDPRSEEREVVAVERHRIKRAEVDAAQAHLVRLQEELHHLQQLQEKLSVHSPLSGLVVTPYVKEKVGQYFEEGDLICEIAEPRVLEAEIALAEQQVARVQPGHTVELKARALPFETFRSKVDRIAPRAEAGEVQSTVTVYCRLENAEAKLQPGMSGYARISCGRRRIGAIALDRTLRFVRTEFWW